MLEPIINERHTTFQPGLETGITSMNTYLLTLDCGHLQRTYFKYEDAAHMQVESAWFCVDCETLCKIVSFEPVEKEEDLVTR